MEEGLPYNIIAAYGGKKNIKHLDACNTRLRVEVYDKFEVKKEYLKQLGAAGVFEVANNVQAIFGISSIAIKNQLEDILTGRQSVEFSFEPIPPKEMAHGEQRERIISEDIVMPVYGELLDITFVPDPLFSEKMMGDGFAVLPYEGHISSPVYGRVYNVFPSKHAIGIKSDGGKEVLIHIGVNTVKLKGFGFNLLVELGERVYAGQPVVEVDWEYLRENVPSILTPIVFTNLPQGSTVTLINSGVLKMGDKPIIEIQ
ncbi:PTS system, glucose subfamily, IIA component [Paenibacillus algorifonticola]|uniref:PTS system, glucose subfamily, IIA component n=1 Tax=Paenibacillus algorifonticola TaxID=684063 RepID=A0A1I2IS52_9BACL|nr:glucose PTS transporter subunit IIA [Paenibacillus algorifonticola]SFF45084.1 PTS system, glucose subfamily, IIA component [Paenibacillus algorifonticola]